MHYAVVRRRAKLTAHYRVIFAIPCNTKTNNQMQYNAIQCNTMQCNRRQYNACNTKKYHVLPYLSRLKPQLGRWGLFSQAGWFHMGCNSAG